MNYSLNIIHVMACDLPEKLQSLGMGNTPKGQVLMDALLNVELFQDFIVVIGKIEDNNHQHQGWVVSMSAYHPGTIAIKKNKAVFTGVYGDPRDHLFIIQMDSTDRELHLGALGVVSKIRKIANSRDKKQEATINQAFGLRAILGEYCYCNSDVSGSTAFAPPSVFLMHSVKNQEKAKYYSAAGIRIGPKWIRDVRAWVYVSPIGLVFRGMHIVAEDSNTGELRTHARYGSEYRIEDSYNEATLMAWLMDNYPTFDPYGKDFFEHGTTKGWSFSYSE